MPEPEPEPPAASLSPQANKAAGRLAIARTATQSTVPGAIILIGSWLCALLHIDLDPGAGTDLPATVSAAFAIVGTTVAAWVMNRGRLRGEA